jgi:PhnB protein
MKIHPYLLFDGNCREAFTAYAKLLGGETVAMLPHAGSPAENFVPAEWREKILHAAIELPGGQLLMASDAPPGHYRKPQGFSIAVQTDTAADAERLFKVLSDGGTVTMPLGKTFWAESFGMLTDRFGTPWQISYQAAAPPPR